MQMWRNKLFVVHTGKIWGLLLKRRFSKTCLIADETGFIVVNTFSLTGTGMNSSAKISLQTINVMRLSTNILFMFSCFCGKVDDGDIITGVPDTVASGEFDERMSVFSEIWFDVGSTCGLFVSFVEWDEMRRVSSHWLVSFAFFFLSTICSLVVLYLKFFLFWIVFCPSVMPWFFGRGGLAIRVCLKVTRFYECCKGEKSISDELALNNCQWKWGKG